MNTNVSAPSAPNDHADAIANRAKPIPTDIPRATGPLFVDEPAIDLVIAAAGIAPIAAEKKITPKVMATSVNTGSPIVYLNSLILIERVHK
jgi:hypothetical protein